VWVPGRRVGVIGDMLLYVYLSLIAKRYHEPKFEEVFPFDNGRLKEAIPPISQKLLIECKLSL